MARFPGIRHLFRPVVRRSVAREIDDELAFHFQSTVEDLVAAGLTREAAEAEARRRFGDERRYREELARLDEGSRAQEQRADWWDGVRHDLRFAWRGLRSRPLFSAAVILTFALGVGANATMFGVVDRLLLQPPPHVGEPDRVARLYFTTESRRDGSSWTGSASNYATYRHLQEAVGDAAELAVEARSELPLGTGADAMQAEAALVSGNFFRVLGVRPALGRFFTPEEGGPQGGAPVAVIGYGLWRSRFGGDPAIIGRSLRIGPGTFTVVGVAPRGFSGPELRRTDLWLPLTAVPRELAFGNWRDDARSYWLDIIARIAPATEPGAVAPRLALAFERLLATDDHRIGGDVQLLSLHGARTSEGERTLQARISTWLLGVAVIVLVIACVNVGNLLLARAAARRREIAVRLAMGARRARIVRQLVVEGLLLAALGGIAALLVVRWGGDFLRAVLLPEVPFAASPVDARVLALTTVLVVATGILTSLVPALHASRGGVSTAISEGGTGGATARSRGQRALLVVQAALSVVLLVGAGLFVRSLAEVRSLDLGFDTDVLIVQVDLQSVGYDGAQTHAFFEEALQRVEALPGVRRASIAQSGPLLMAMGGSIRLPGRDSLPRLPGGGPYYNRVGGDFFVTLGATITEGRGLTRSDRGQAVVVVNETMAEAYWPGRSAVGECVYLFRSNACTTVVGIVEDARRFALEEDAAPQWYAPLDTAGGRRRTLFIQPAGEPHRIAADVRGAIQSLRAGLPYVSVRSYADVLDPQIRPWRLGASLFAVFGGLALLLAAVGLFGVLAFTVVRRTREFGIRGALGADRVDIVQMVLVDGLTVATIGVALGIGAAMVAAPRIAPLLFDTSPRDPLVMLGAMATLLAAAAFAALLPAWRASRVEPRIALQAE